MTGGAPQGRPFVVANGSLSIPPYSATQFTVGEDLMFAVARAVVRRPVPFLCVAAVIGYLAMSANEKPKKVDPWGPTVAQEAPAAEKDSMFGKAAAKAADLVTEADTTGTVAKVRGTVETTANSWENTSTAVGEATGN